MRWDAVGGRGRGYTRGVGSDGVRVKRWRGRRGGVRRKNYKGRGLWVRVRRVSMRLGRREECVRRDERGVKGVGCGQESCGLA